VITHTIKHTVGLLWTSDSETHSDPKFGRRRKCASYIDARKKVPERRSRLHTSEKNIGTAFRRLPSQKYPCLYRSIAQFLPAELPVLRMFSFNSASILGEGAGVCSAEFVLKIDP
jgi:hypothetical protein